MFTKDSRTENFLTQLGCDFRYSNKITFTDLAPGWDIRNAGRSKPKVEAAILEYAQLMEAGSAAPGPILHKTPRGLDVLDGVQRLNAVHILGTTELSGYIITTDSDTLPVTIRVIANLRLQGHPEVAEWTKRHAIQMLILERGMSVDEVCRIGGWKASDIARLCRILDWGYKIRCIGGPQLPDNMVDTISQNATLDMLPKVAEPAAKFLHILHQARFSNGDSEPHVKEFFAPVPKRKQPHVVYTSRLNKFLAEDEVQARIEGRSRAKLRPDIHLRRAMKTVLTVLDDMLAESHHAVFVDEFFRLHGQMHDKLMALKRPKTVKPR